MKLDLHGFKCALTAGFLLPDNYSYGYVDEAKYEVFRQQQKWDESKLTSVFNELQQRMSRRYFVNVSLAQIAALDYSSLQFPVYSILSGEDLSDDWLAIVDFHKKYCRDHSLHQPLTAYVAASLLGFGKAENSLQIPSQPSNLLDYCVDVLFKSKEASYVFEESNRFGLPKTMTKDSFISREFWKGLFYRTVILSALFHDIGYPWQYVNRIGESLNKSVRCLFPSDSVALSIVKDFKNRMVYLPLRNYQHYHYNELVGEEDRLVEQTQIALMTHGFPGAIAFLSLNDAIRKHPTEHPLARLQEFSVEWAAMGVFMHDMEGTHRKNNLGLRLNINQDPLSTIVSIADFLEEFNRPKVTFVPKAHEGRIKYYSDCSSVEIRLNEGCVLEVLMSYNKESHRAIAAAFKTEETDNYFNPNNGFINLSPIGIRRVVYKQI